MTTEHQPGSQVDIAEFEAHGGSWSRNRLLDTAVLAVTELRTLRARVGELEACLTDLHLFAGRGDGHETAGKVADCIAGVIIHLRADLEKAGVRSDLEKARAPEENGK